MLSKTTWNFPFLPPIRKDADPENWRIFTNQNVVDRKRQKTHIIVKSIHYFAPLVRRESKKRIHCESE